MPKQLPSEPLENAKFEIFSIERAAGVESDRAYLASGVGFPMMRLPGETEGKRRSRVAQQTLVRIESRIEILEQICDSSTTAGEKMRHYRALAELRWCRGLVANGGCEPAKWSEASDEGQPDSSPSS